MKDVGRVPAPRRWWRTPAVSGKPGRDPHRISAWLAALTSPRVACSNAIEKRAAFCWRPLVVSWRASSRQRSLVIRTQTEPALMRSSRAARTARFHSGALRPGSRWLLVLSTAGSSRLATTAGGVRSHRFRREASITSTCCHRFVCETDDIPTLSGRLRVVFRPRGRSQLPRNI